jgi:gamma-glutamyltranspeptidase/glutathione hydrolase
MRIAVSATGHQALAAGLEVAGEGGNAVDAALAASFVALATEPGMVSLAGGCYVSVWPADDEPVVVDGNVEMPGRGADPARLGHGVREIVTTYGGGVTMHAGAGSVATPGIVPAFGLVHERFARLDWGRLITPAARAVTDGYPMSHAAARYLAIVADSLFAPDPEAFALLTGPGGGLLGGGERTTNPALADVLRQLATDGPRLFRTGRVAQAMVDHMTAEGGLVTAEDLTAYRPVERPAYRLDVGDWDVAVNPPPAVGGPLLAVMLGELARRGQWTWSDAIEIQRAVHAYRLDVHDRSWDLEADGLALLDRVRSDGLASLSGSGSTAHISAVDEDGTACAITMSSGYGAGSCIPGTGILLNNCLGETELNAHGLHATEPGTRLASNMAPTTARLADGSVLAIGTPGADRITTALAQVIIHIARHGESLQTAIDRPRMHPRRLDDGTDRIEHERDPGIAASLDAVGMARHEHPPQAMYFGGVGGALLRPDGTLEAGADPRRAAATLVT